MIRFRIPSFRECAAAISLGLAAGNAIAPHVHSQTATAAPTVALPSGQVGGVAVNYTGWIANSPKRVTGKGLVIQGKGIDQTIIDGGANATASITIGDNSGRVEIRDCTIVCGQTFGIVYGSKRGEWDGAGNYKPGRAKLHPDSMLVLRNVRIVTRPPAAGKQTSTKWPVSTENVDHDWANVEVDCPTSAEHVYVHGYAKHGVLWNNVRVESIGGEGLKLVCRPWESFFVPDAWLVIRNCTFRNFANVWGGGGIVLQGPALKHVLIERTVIYGGDRGKAACLRFDDGLSVIQHDENNRRRRYDIHGVESGPGPDIGSLTLRMVAWTGSNAETMRIGTIYPGYQQALGVPYHRVVESLTIAQSGAYGAASRISLSDTGTVAYRANNVDPVKTFLPSIGVQTDDETTVGGKVLSGVNQ